MPDYGFTSTAAPVGSGPQPSRPASWRCAKASTSGKRSPRSRRASPQLIRCLISARTCRGGGTAAGGAARATGTRRRRSADRRSLGGAQPPRRHFVSAVVQVERELELGGVNATSADRDLVELRHFALL